MCTISDHQRLHAKIATERHAVAVGTDVAAAASGLFIRDDGKRLLGFARDKRYKIIPVTRGSWRIADRLQQSGR